MADFTFSFDSDNPFADPATAPKKPGDPNAQADPLPAEGAVPDATPAPDALDLASDAPNDEFDAFDFSFGDDAPAPQTPPPPEADANDDAPNPFALDDEAEEATEIETPSVAAQVPASDEPAFDDSAFDDSAFDFDASPEALFADSIEAAPETALAGDEPASENEPAPQSAPAAGDVTSIRVSDAVSAAASPAEAAPTEAAPTEAAPTEAAPTEAAPAEAAPAEAAPTEAAPTEAAPAEADETEFASADADEAEFTSDEAAPDKAASDEAEDETASAEADEAEFTSGGAAPNEAEPALVEPALTVAALAEVAPEATASAEVDAARAEVAAGEVRRTATVAVLTVAILGASGIGKNHARWFDRNGCRVVAFLGSSDDSTARTEADLSGEFEFTGQSYTDLGELLAQERPDIVCVATPTPLHFAHVLQSLEAGAHVLCEKPLVYAPTRKFRENRDGAKELVRVAAKKNLTLGTQLQYGAATPILCKLAGIAPNEVGDFAMEIETVNPGAPRDPRELWIDLGPHPVSVAQMLAGPGATLDEDSMRFEPFQNEEKTEIMARFGVNCADGRLLMVRAVVRALRDSSKRTPRRRFAFNGHSIVYAPLKTSKGQMQAQFIAPDGYASVYSDPVDYLIGDFVRACRESHAPMISGDFGRENLEWMLKIGKLDE